MSRRKKNKYEDVVCTVEELTLSDEELIKHRENQAKLKLKEEARRKKELKSVKPVNFTISGERREDLEKIADTVENFLCLDYNLDNEKFPGDVFEACITIALGGKNIKSGYVDVLHKGVDLDVLGIQAKSSQDQKSTRFKEYAKFNRDNFTSPQQAGDMLLTILNDYIRKAIKDHELDKLIYTKIIMIKGGFKLFNILLWDRATDTIDKGIFHPGSFRWDVNPEATGSKNFSIKGYYKTTDDPWFTFSDSDRRLYLINEKDLYNSDNPDIITRILDPKQRISDNELKYARKNKEEVFKNYDGPEEPEEPTLVEVLNDIQQE